MTIREIEAKSILRKYKKIDSWFISHYGMNLYRGCTHIKAERKKLTLWICRLFNITDKRAFINYEERIEKNKRSRQSNREDYTRNTRNWKLILLQKIIDRIKIKSNKILNLLPLREREIYKE